MSWLGISLSSYYLLFNFPCSLSLCSSLPNLPFDLSEYFLVYHSLFYSSFSYSSVYHILVISTLKYILNLSQSTMN